MATIPVQNKYSIQCISSNIVRFECQMYKTYCLKFFQTFTHLPLNRSLQHVTLSYFSTEPLPSFYLNVTPSSLFNYELYELLSLPTDLRSFMGSSIFMWCTSFQS